MITVSNDFATSKVKQFTFNDGSVQVQLENPSVIEGSPNPNIIVMAELLTPADQMALVLTIDAIRNLRVGLEILLLIPFCPYGRQDSVFDKGQANGMRAWANLLNSLDLHGIVVMDAHSNAIDLVKNSNSVDVVDILLDLEIVEDRHLLVSPDAGANKKCHKIAKEFKMTEMIRADKARDVLTGNILETIVYGDVEGRDCLIVDDICDGGMTFIKLAEALREKGAKSVTLFITHALFTKGLGVFEGLIDKIHTTNSMPSRDYDTDGYTGELIIHNTYNWS